MPFLTVVYWRDIPAQVLVRSGRRRERSPLPERFEKAIDRAAMRAGARDEEAYLADWRKAEPVEVDGDPRQIAEAEASRLVDAYPAVRLRSLIEHDGWEK